MFEPRLYFPIYLTIAYLLVIVKSIPPESILNKDSGSSGLLKAFVVGSFFILFFGFRPTEDDPNMYMADTVGYAEFYEMLKVKRDALYFGLLTNDGKFDLNSEFIFNGIRNYCAVLQLPVYIWLSIISIIFIIPKILTAKILFPGREYLAFLFLITAMGFYSGGTNGIRNAAGSSVFMLGLVFICCKNPRKLIGWILCICSYYFHHSEIILIGSIILSLFFVKNTKTAIIIWFCAIISSLAAGNTLAAVLGPLFEDERVNSYVLDPTLGYRTGFRWDFILYSAMPILMGWYTTVRLKIVDKTYQVILNTYIIANAIWIIFMYAAFTNRFAALSWSLYPIVLCYPLLRYNVFGISTPQKTSLILFFQLIFLTII